MTDTQIRIVCVGKLSPNGNQVKIVPEAVWTGEIPADHPRLLTDAECAAEADDLEDDILDREDWARGGW